MSNTLKLLCLAMLPSLSFASDQAPIVDLSGYKLTQKVLAAYFMATKKYVSSFKTTIYTRPDNAEITVFGPNLKDSIVNFQLKSSGVLKNKFAPALRRDILTLALVEAFDKSLDNKSWSTWLREKLTGCTKDQNSVLKERWLDNGIACKYDIGPYGPEISCRGSIPRDLFNIIKEIAEKNISSAKQPDYAPCPPSVAINSSESRPSSINSTINATANKTEENDFLKQIREQRLSKTSPAQKKVCTSFIEQLVRSGQYNAKQEGNTTNVSFKFKFSDKMHGFNEDVLKHDCKKYGDDKIPSYICIKCSDDIESLSTWFFWWSFYNSKGSSAQYFLENGSDVVLNSTSATNGFSGYVSMPTELFEAMKQEAANKASE